MRIADKNERQRLYEIAQRWLCVAKGSVKEGDYQGELVALDYVFEIINELKEER